MPHGKLQGLNCIEALESVPYSWLLRFRIFLWYSESLGATQRFAMVDTANDTSTFERMLG